MVTQVHNYGGCERTHNETETGSREERKAKTLRKYKFCLAFENTIEFPGGF
ncbi:hypothetical protein T484DRAFT_1804487 [Baffinella frigidus]|nr:hypothetical protein T484DRAFT_1804487 [Cryptophyta sp. CCMP2293]